MADILLRRDSTLAATYVPNTFIDEYMTHADGEFVKIYLYLLRCMNHPDTAFSISDIADRFEHTEKDVKRALRYWEKMQLLRLEFDQNKELTGICLSDFSARQAPRAGAQAHASGNAMQAPASSDVAKAPASYAGTQARAPYAAANGPVSCAAKAPASYVATQMPVSDAAVKGPVSATAAQATAFSDTAQPHQLPERITYSKDELAQFREDETVSEILFVTERYMGHPLNDTEVQTVLYWLDQLEFSQDMVEFLVEECVAKNRMSIRYMDKVATEWAKAGIHTLAGAKEEIRLHSKAVYAVQKAYGITNRTLGSAELAYVQRWSEEMKFSDEMIALACEKTIQAIHNINFGYTQSILESWKKQKAQTANDVKLLDAQYQNTKVKKYAVGKAAIRAAKNTGTNGFTNFPQRTYNFDEIERQLLAQTR